mmetsp:Transcript_6240/g.15141  ORF Transcript_6240/g.15141 Transcript_6240/m.15141 type:complete len:221 (-) Transcript_6240:1928-2590(-)
MQVLFVPPLDHRPFRQVHYAQLELGRRPRLVSLRQHSSVVAVFPEEFAEDAREVDPAPLVFDVLRKRVHMVLPLVALVRFEKLRPSSNLLVALGLHPERRHHLHRVVPVQLPGVRASLEEALHELDPIETDRHVQRPLDGFLLLVAFHVRAIQDDLHHVDPLPPDGEFELLPELPRRPLPPEAVEEAAEERAVEVRRVRVLVVEVVHPAFLGGRRSQRLG